MYLTVQSIPVGFHCLIRLDGTMEQNDIEIIKKDMISRKFLRININFYNQHISFDIKAGKINQLLVVIFGPTITVETQRLIQIDHHSCLKLIPPFNVFQIGGTSGPMLDTR